MFCGNVALTVMGGMPGSEIGVTICGCCTVYVKLDTGLGCGKELCMLNEPVPVVMDETSAGAIGIPGIAGVSKYALASIAPAKKKNEIEFFNDKKNNLFSVSLLCEVCGGAWKDE